MMTLKTFFCGRHVQLRRPAALNARWPDQ